MNTRLQDLWWTAKKMPLIVVLVLPFAYMLASITHAAPQDAKPLVIQAHDYVAVVTRVVDGDTVDLRVTTWPTHILEDRFRLKGINAPETRGEERPEGLKTTQWLKDKLAPHAEIIVRIPTNRRGDRARGKYGRWLGTLLVPGADGTLIDLNKLMVAEGFAKVANY